jgi:hypothetical protein
MELPPRRFEVDAIDSNGKPCKLTITKYPTIPPGGNPADAIALRATCHTADGELLLQPKGKFECKFRSQITGKEFTTKDPRVMER